MIVTENTIPINKGSDLTFALNWPNAAGGNADLTGAAIEAFDCHPATLEEAITLSIVDPAEGRIEGRLEWSDTMPFGRAMFFRIRVTVAGNRASTDKIMVVVR